jgi:multiple sugar transport system ATP-binding protein
MAEVSYVEASRIYPGNPPVTAVNRLNLEIADGEFLVLVGPSGCGKSTALRMLAGLEDVSEGEIRISGKDVSNKPPKDRDIAMVFQNYALYPHMTVADNMGFALKLKGVPKAKREEQVLEAAKLLDLEKYLDRKHKALSGGQRQRDAMGRAIVRCPAVFLMDEPLSNLDAKLRVEMRGEIIRVQRRIAAPTLYVTHDQTEAMTMGDRVAILRDGVLQQLGTPDEVYDKPVNSFVAGFIGSPAMNLLPATLSDKQGDLSVSFGTTQLTVPSRVLESRPELAGYAGRQVTLGIRPEDFAPAERGDGLANVTVDRVESLGSELVVYLDAGVESPLTARLERRVTFEAGQEAQLAVDLNRLYFFDAESGDAIG